MCSASDSTKYEVHMISEHPDILNKSEWKFINASTTLRELKSVRKIGYGGIGEVYLCEDMKANLEKKWFQWQSKLLFHIPSIPTN
jgi:hypothetical protein